MSGSEDEIQMEPEGKMTRMEPDEESFMSTDSDEIVVKKLMKRKVSDDSDDDWVPEEKPEPKKRVKTERKAPVKKEPKPRVKKEPQPRVKKEPKPRVKKEPKPKAVKEPKIKKETKINLKTEMIDQKENLFGVNMDEPKDINKNNDDVKKASHDLKPYNVPQPAWEPAELLSDMMGINFGIARNIIQLFENDNTIPFIARYRKELTGDMDPETLRRAKESFENVKAIQTKAASILKLIEKTGKLTPVVERCVLGARSLYELEHIYAPYKVGGKRTKAEAARQLGLEKPALALLNGTDYVCLETYINPEIDGLTTIYDVENGICHIIADIMSKDKDVLDMLRKLQKDCHMKLESCKSRTTKTNEKAKVKDENKPQSKMQNNKLKNNAHNKDDAEGKYQNYYTFSQNVRYVKPHQVLAINRGEHQKALSVKLVIPDWLNHRLMAFCRMRFMNTGYEYPLRKHMFEKSFQDAYTRLIQPLVIRSVRAELNRMAETASIEVFAMNLKKLLLSPPLRGKTILGLDPGFKNGCKAAITSSNGAILEATVLHFNLFMKFKIQQDFAASQLRELLLRHNCEIIGLGNGTACRETENYLSQLISMGWFRPLDVKYTIVSENGASIYSCSPEAAKEFPNMDPNLISAVSLARRLQEPLCELVKVEPKHLGVGMYQHDVPEKQLSSTLDEVVSECVSFVGVDVNTSSHTALRRVAGLNALRATKIIEWRDSNGPFTNRQQLKLVKGIGDKSYEQSAGFIRILPQTLNAIKKEAFGGGESSNPSKKGKTAIESQINPLDQTWIHPEMYPVANRFLSKCQVQLRDLGTRDFIRRVSETVAFHGVNNLATEFGVSVEQIKLISEGLQLMPDYDFRSNFSKPLFRTGVTSFEDLNVGDLLTGRVQNVTHFGSFVDIGVGSDGLIPASRIRNLAPQLGDKVEVRVISVEIQRRRIGLDLVNIL